MPHASEHRLGPDRRGRSRGGRRPGDADGFAPLVMLVGNDPTVVDLAEAVLAKLRFAVTTSADVEDVLRKIPSLRPDIVVADTAAAARIRRDAPEHLSPVVMTDAMRRDPHVLIESIRQRLRTPLPS